MPVCTFSTFDVPDTPGTTEARGVNDQDWIVGVANPAANLTAFVKESGGRDT